MSGSPFRLVEPPDGESRGGDRKADRQDERDPPQLAEPLAQQLKQSSATYHSPPRVQGTLVLDRHERVVSRRSKIHSLTFRPS